ncbi:hypothetical protein M501DRAFT_927647 [Patellaria atrata CBS 101060]|uniref:Uncharacterized protein n=1 Tax=Patellaria atrata CBS 101060 TaxID=1346257 RepID=A0A9P4SGE1_9PEZI|nr:hypothetical protein M501DRAFT_927647 [Patellaria atrata CBS 101060]
MGVDTRRPALPAPTEPSVLSSIDNGSALGPADDLATDVSRRTDKTSYSIPEDGSPITVSTRKITGDSSTEIRRGRNQSQTSLLIEYFEAGKGDKPRSRPSVRVRVTPSSSKRAKNKGDEHIQITQTGSSRKPSYTRRISLGNKNGDSKPAALTGTDVSFSSDSNLSGRPPVEVEVLHNTSDLTQSDISGGGRYIPPTSDISSMPPDSMLDIEPVVKIQTPRRRRSRSLERAEETVTKDTLKTPTRRRSRSLSRERITQKVMAKLAEQPAESSRSSRHRRERSISKELLAEGTSSPRRKTSKVEWNESNISGADSSLLAPSRRSGDQVSVRSGTSAASSINNPKLLQTVEDAIKRLILPELNALKEEQKTQKNRNQFEHITRGSVASSSSREDSSIKRRVSKSSSAPDISKPKVVLNRTSDDPGLVLSGDSIKSRKVRRSSKDSTSERSYERRDSIDHGDRPSRKSSRESSRSHNRAKDAAAIAGVAGLTAAALKHHDSQTSLDTKERRKKRTKSRSRTASISETLDEERRSKEVIPPMPMQSDIQTDLTRDSILTADTERPASRSSRGYMTPVREVSRGSPQQVVSPVGTPTRTPVSLQRGIGTHHNNRSQGDVSLPSAKSDRSIGSKGRQTGLSAAGLAGVAALSRQLHAKSHHEDEHLTQQVEKLTIPARELSPVQSIASYQEDAVNIGLPGQAGTVRSGAPLSPTADKARLMRSDLSIDSLASSPSAKLASQHRRTGSSLSKDEGVMEQFINDSELEKGTGTPAPADVDEWYERQHEENERYRHSYDSPSQRDSSNVGYQRMTNYTDDSIDGPYLDPITSAQGVRGVGANPEYVRTPVAVESAVASLHEPSTISVRSSHSSQLGGYIRGAPHGLDISKGPLHPPQTISSGDDTITDVHDSPSKERWAALRDGAHLKLEETQGSRATNSPRQSIARTASVDSQPVLTANAMPFGSGPDMPEIGHIADDDSELTTNPSPIQGPGPITDQSQYGSQYGNWPTGPTPPLSAADMRDTGIAAAAAERIRKEEKPAEQLYHQPSVEDVHDTGLHYDRSRYIHDQDNLPSSPMQGKERDEGYVSAAKGGITPEPHYADKVPKLFDDDGDGDYNDPFISKTHNRNFSGNSHGLASPLYDSATGQGIDRIHSKDIVALMDHLTVRDAQRNARDTEILVTLVRSAAEMRNSFEEMKKFIAEQDQLIMKNADKIPNATAQKVLQGPRPQPVSAPRGLRQGSTEEIENTPQRRKNVFKRALRGLSMNSSNDLAKIEEMLVKLLGEVESLKETQASAVPLTREASLTSYENLRASGDAGYEPEGLAGTSSSPNQSGYFSNPSSRQINAMHSGYDRRDSGHRISTVLEGDEDLEEHEAEVLDNQFENSERLLTPTQEVRRKNVPDQTPPLPVTAFIRGSQSNENTPKTDKSKKHKSTASSIFGIPKISRWSKTTASTEAPRESFRDSGKIRKERPYSQTSKSGSNLALNYYDDGYEVHEDDRLRSQTSLNDQPRSLHESQAGSARSPSPLIPEQEFDDPKYQAHRNSLNLQHPQPRPGPTHRHQTHLESQAQYFPVHDDDPASPDTDQWGSNPSLALNRNRWSGGHGTHQAGNLSPISSDGGYAPPRPPKLKDDGPLVPPKIPEAQDNSPKAAYSSPLSSGHFYGSQLEPIEEVRHSLETEGLRDFTPSPAPGARPNAAMQSPARKITGPRPMGSRSPSGSQGMAQDQADLRKETLLGTVRRKPVRGDSPGE